jgi:hypothetical protein
MAGWFYTASCPGRVAPKGVICTVMEGPYRLPCWTVLSALARAAQLQADDISSCPYIVNVQNQPSDITHGRQGPALYVNSSLDTTLILRLYGWLVVGGEGGGEVVMCPALNT